jgi:hypothetical protein
VITKFFSNSNLSSLHFVYLKNETGMAEISFEMAALLRNTARHIGRTSQYQWGHMGSCNCGFLAQEITKLPKDEIHARAMQQQGDWTEQLNDYCAQSGLPMDDVIGQILARGFDTADLKHLERLSDPKVLQAMGAGEKGLRHNFKKDVIEYLESWAALVVDKLLGEFQPNVIAAKISTIRGDGKGYNRGADYSDLQTETILEDALLP